VSTVRQGHEQPRPSLVALLAALLLVSAPVVWRWLMQD